MTVNQLEWRQIRLITADVVMGIALFFALAAAVTFDGGMQGVVKFSNMAIIMLAIVFSALFAFSRGFCRHLLQLHR